MSLFLHLHAFLPAGCLCSFSWVLLNCLLISPFSEPSVCVCSRSSQTVLLNNNQWVSLLFCLLWKLKEYLPNSTSDTFVILHIFTMGSGREAEVWFASAWRVESIYSWMFSLSSHIYTYTWTSLCFIFSINVDVGLPWWPSCYRICLQCRRPWFIPWVRKMLACIFIFFTLSFPVCIPCVSLD